MHNLCRIGARYRQRFLLILAKRSGRTKMHHNNSVDNGHEQKFVQNSYSVWRSARKTEVIILPNRSVAVVQKLLKKLCVNSISNCCILTNRKGPRSRPTFIDLYSRPRAWARTYRLYLRFNLNDSKKDF